MSDYQTPRKEDEAEKSLDEEEDLERLATRIEKIGFFKVAGKVGKRVGRNMLNGMLGQRRDMVDLSFFALKFESNTRLNFVKMMHLCGEPLDLKDLLLLAAKNGHLKCLKYAHEEGCPWGRWTCQNAARGGHLECLKYAHENGCPEAAPEQVSSSQGHPFSCKYFKHSS